MNKPSGRTVRVAVAVAVASALGLTAVAVSADPEPPEVSAEIAVAPSSPARLDGSWPEATTTTTTTTPIDPETGLTVSGPMGPPWPDEFIVADAVADQVAIYSEPDVPVPTGRTLPNPTVEGYRLVMLVREVRGDWLQVQINTRPNGATTWIRAEDVELRTVPNRILVELGAKRLTVFQGDEAIFTAPVAPGRDATPTPLGFFYVDILTRPTNPSGPYGAFQISVTGFSEVYDSFGGGNGQIAIHGTNRPELIGTPASNGCVRMSNADVTALVKLARQGTPVEIVA